MILQPREETVMIEVCKIIKNAGKVPPREQGMSCKSIRKQVQRQLFIQHTGKLCNCSLQDMADPGLGRNWTTS